MPMNKYRVVYLPTLLIEAESVEAAANAASKILLTGLNANYVDNDDKVHEQPMQFDISEVVLDGRFNEPEEADESDGSSEEDHGAKPEAASE
jgi:hypothetical protein